MAKTLSFTGHRPKDLAGNEEDVRQALDRLVFQSIQKGYRTFISGMALGVDMWAAECVIRFKEQHDDVKLIAAVPFPGQTMKYGERSQQSWEHILWNADRINIYNPSTHENEWVDAAVAIEMNRDAVENPKMSGGWPYIQVVKWLDDRNHWMIDHSDAVVAVYNGKGKGGTANAVRYALSLDKPIVLFNPDTGEYSRRNFS